MSNAQAGYCIVCHTLLLLKSLIALFGGLSLILLEIVPNSYSSSANRGLTHDVVCLLHLYA